MMNGYYKMSVGDTIKEWEERGSNMAAGLSQGDSRLASGVTESREPGSEKL